MGHHAPRDRVVHSGGASGHLLLALIAAVAHRSRCLGADHVEQLHASDQVADVVKSIDADGEDTSL
jgi:hypothetical protein